MLTKRRIYIDIDKIIVRVGMDNIGIISPFKNLEAYLTQCVISNKDKLDLFSHSSEFTYNWIFKRYKKWKLEQ